MKIKTQNIILTLCLLDNTKSNMKSVVFLVLIGVLLHIVSGQRCPFPVNLVAQEHVQEFDSHPSYGNSTYHPNMHACWVIEAPEGENVHLKTDAMDLQHGCTEHDRDRVMIYDGEDENAELNEFLCGNDELYDYHTSGKDAYIEFFTDDSVEGDGFRISYWSEADDSVGIIIGFVVGLLVGLAIIIALIVACVICCRGNKTGKVHSTTPGQGTNNQNQPYPTQQYATAGNKGGAVITASGQTVHPTKKMAPGPGTQAAQSHPVDANGVPMPAVYIDP